MTAARKLAVAQAVCPCCVPHSAHAPGKCDDCSCKVESRPGKSAFIIREPKGTYFKASTGLGPMFGATKVETPRFKTSDEIGRLVGGWSFTTYKVEAIPLEKESRDPAPFLKWAGGKRQLVEELRKSIPEDFWEKGSKAHYYEPFVGGGALFFALRASGWDGAATLGDAHERLVRTYLGVRNDVEMVIEILREQEYDEKEFYAERARKIDDAVADQDVAAWLIYLNRTCFTPGSQVLLESECSKSIEDVCVGERLWNGRIVTEVIKRSYVGGVRRISVQGSPYTLSVTGDHPVLVVKGRPEGTRQDRRSPEDFQSDMELQPADNLNIGDYVCLPTRGTLEQAVNWHQFWPNDYEFGPQVAPTRLSDSVDDRDVGRLLGYYAAEGAIHYRAGVDGPRFAGVAWTFNSNELNTYVADVVALCERLFGVRPGVYPDSGEIDRVTVQVHRAHIGKFIHTLIPGKSWAEAPSERKTKRLNPVLLTAPLSVQSEILKGWLRGDGGLKHREATNSSELSGTCTVLPMARQMYRLAQRCGLKPSWRLSYPHGNETAHVYFAGPDIDRLGFQSLPRKKVVAQRRFINGYLLVRITDIVDLEWSGPVYNLEVDGDHLICVDGVVSHNCFNGLYRVNSKTGAFNVPFGRYTNPMICDVEGLRAASRALRKTKILSADFERTVKSAEAGDLVYFDPPYWPASESSDFTRYTKGGFGPEDQERLRNCAWRLKKLGVNVILSNADVPPVRKLYKGFNIRAVKAVRAINSKATGRGPVGELIIC